MNIYGYRYDKEVLGFFPLTKPYTPAEGLISIERHAELMSEQGAGKILVPDDKGNPIAIERPAPSNEELSKIVRGQRDAKLAKTDWTQLKDCQLGDQDIVRWQAYRQALRDLPRQSGFPKAVVWPEEPAMSE
ncbi:MAG: hypothetical protein CL942_08485 [Desulfovibrio sp.]|nr:hypothetical protein [Desulfovibrio sp.]|tara:strand:+ start:84 stop:479 length:396 start_codon:yes stop_codon:yes gene_type:complete